MKVDIRSGLTRPWAGHSNRRAVGSVPLREGCGGRIYYGTAESQNSAKTALLTGGPRERYNQEKRMAATSVPTAKLTSDADDGNPRGHAGFSDYAGVALDSLRANKLRSFLTLLGIIIGITSIISVISIIQGLDHYWKAKVSNFGPNTFVITQFPITTNIDQLYEMIRRNPEIRADIADAIRKGCTACEAVGVETHKEARVKHGRQALESIDIRA